MTAKTFIAVAFAAMLGFSQSAGAASCTPVGRAAKAMTDGDAEVAIDMGAEEASEWLDRYNRLPPPTSFTADRIIVLERPGEPEVLLMAGRKGCLAWLLLVSRKVWLQISRGDGV